MDTTKQFGATDCGLYAIAIATAIAFGLDSVILGFKLGRILLIA